MHRQRFLQKLLPAIAAVLFTAAAAPGEPMAAIDKPLVLAQAGSTGGTIGKQEKSASGGKVRAPKRVRQAPAARKHHMAERAERAPRVPKHHIVVREPQAPRARKHPVSEPSGAHRYYYPHWHRYFYWRPGFWGHWRRVHRWR